MTELYSEWRDFYAGKVRSWMSLEELRSACGKLSTTDSPSPELLLLIHAMHALEAAREDAEDAAWCAECGVKLETVRPGKHQHPTCSQAQPLTDDALLRQVLEVLSRAHQAAMVQTLKARVPECAEFAGIAQDLDFVVAALRERLGEKA